MNLENREDESSMSTNVPPFDGTDPWWRGNLHCHSDRSDGLLSPGEVARRYAENGYDFLAITDHFISDFGFPITGLERGAPDGLTLLHGAELHAPATTHGEWWHILAVGLPKTFARTSDIEDGVALARRAQDAGAFVAIAHPEWSGLSEQDTAALSFAHAVEVYNHTSALRTDRGGGWPWLERLWDAGGHQYALAVDDAHFQVDDAFGGWINLRAPSSEPEDLLASLKAGRFYATQGPEIHDIRLEDGRVEVDTSPVSGVFVLAPGARSAHRLADEMTEASIPWSSSSPPWLRVAVRDREGRRAWTGRIDPGV